MADDKNQGGSQDQPNTQQPDRKNVNLANEQDTGAEMGRQQQQRGTSDWQNSTPGSGEGEQSERGSTDHGNKGL